MRVFLGHLATKGSIHIGWVLGASFFFLIHISHLNISINVSILAHFRKHFIKSILIAVKYFLKAIRIDRTDLSTALLG